MDDLSQVDANNTDESVVEEGQVDQNTNNNWDPIVEDEDEEDDDWPITEETEEAESEAEPESDKEEEDQFPEDEDEDEDADKESKDEDEWELKAFDHEEKVADLERKKELAQKGLAYELRVDQLKQQRQQLAIEQEQLKEQLTSTYKDFIQTFASNDPNVHAAIYEELRKTIPNMPSFQQVVDGWIEQQLQFAGMSPEEKAALVIQQEQQRLALEKQQIEEERQRQINAYEEQRAYDHIMEEIPKALAVESIQPTPSAIRRIAEIWAIALDQGQTPTARQVVQAYKNERLRDRRDDLSVLDEDQILERLGPDVIEKVRKADLKRFKKSRPKPEARSKKKQTSNQGYISESEWREGKR